MWGEETEQGGETQEPGESLGNVSKEKTRPQTLSVNGNPVSKIVKNPQVIQEESVCRVCKSRVGRSPVGDEK